MQEQQHSTPSAAQRLRPVLILGTLLAVITGGLFLYTSVLTSVSYEVDVEPPVLYAGSTDSAVLRVYGVNRLGSAVPFSRPRIVVAVEEGGALISLRACDDSTRYVLRPRDHAGVALLRVETPEWPFPLLVSVRITVPMALRSSPRRPCTPHPAAPDPASMHIACAQPVSGRPPFVNPPFTEGRFR